jgi:hypothetical protein
MKRNDSCHIEQSRPSLQQLLSASHAFLLRYQRGAVARAVAPVPVAFTQVAFVPVVSVPVAFMQEPIGVELIAEPMCAEASALASALRPSVPLPTARR